MKNKKESYFWTSYSDLMTSLFFVMLVLFVVTICMLHQRMVATEKELDEIKRIEDSTKDLPKKYFEYNEEYEKFVLKIDCKFNVGDATIQDSTTLKKLKEAGMAICYFLGKYRQNSYLLIVEGQASKDNYTLNYELSYRRALALIEYWNSEKDIRQEFGRKCEVLIAGSGDNRIALGKKPMREENEIDNQRFIIHIIPKNIINSATKDISQN
ncbi:MAG: hypothetical protein IJ213_05175 [Bacteroidales bacterium]|nr:hypothetical protein [Bacteroidales bacterium]